VDATIFFVWSITAVFAIAIGIFLNGTAVLARESKEQLSREQELTAALGDALEGQRNLQKLMLHELKRPISAISSMAQASNGEDIDSLKRNWARLKKLSRQADGYLQSIGAFDEINALLDAPDLSPLSVDAFACDIATKWGVTVDLCSNAKNNRILADELLMDIAIGNLIENARKFGKNPENTTLCIDIADEYVAFDVIDDGLGIPVAEQEKVFGKFYKMGNSSENALKGCGLGLYLVRRVALAHGGQACVKDQTPSTLRIAIPFRHEA